ncbi:MAG: type 1 glutamine amidotransferase [Alphaproteobacteria bacterium]|mgnify:CR=1 FL=1|jgi:GMP synthase-like glutamine amidotransferase|nr:type 1 glutamine amidotransferase [Rhodospirillaceae bacterium]MBT7614041.1 type 1 glutamine amidotransferase [Rhodospirillaceae bacterium]MBT7649109.1 type 1 glutamine amidotransferase [Rhodospirillaceae bacterium]MDG2482332.1 type 1 glutamine amidotransferase [Alphaproteobacteria bacterium]
MRFLIFQHIAIEHPGIFRDLMTEHGIGWDPVELDEGEPIPPLDGYDALLVMGGPMDVFDEAECPWLVPEKAAIRQAVREKAIPYFGFCLGHQLLADALGGTCERMPAPEVGILDIALTHAGADDALMAGIPSSFKALQWHGVAVTKTPEGGTALASSPVCAIQAQRVGEHAWGLQYHVEMTAATVREWGAVPAYGDALGSIMGEGALERFDAECQARMAEFNAASRTLFRNFLVASGLN